MTIEQDLADAQKALQAERAKTAKLQESFIKNQLQTRQTEVAALTSALKLPTEKVEVRLSGGENNADQIQSTTWSGFLTTLDTEQMAAISELLPTVVSAGSTGGEDGDGEDSDSLLFSEFDAAGNALFDGPAEKQNSAGVDLNDTSVDVRKRLAAARRAKAKQLAAAASN